MKLWAVRRIWEVVLAFPSVSPSGCSSVTLDVHILRPHPDLPQVGTASRAVGVSAPSVRPAGLKVWGELREPLGPQGQPRGRDRALGGRGASVSRLGPAGDKSPREQRTRRARKPPRRGRSLGGQGAAAAAGKKERVPGPRSLHPVTRTLGAGLTAGPPPWEKWDQPGSCGES